VHIGHDADTELCEGLSFKYRLIFDGVLLLLFLGFLFFEQGLVRLVAEGAPLAVPTTVAVLGVLGDTALGEQAKPGEGNANRSVLNGMQVIENLASVRQLVAIESWDLDLLFLCLLCLFCHSRG